MPQGNCHGPAAGQRSDTTGCCRHPLRSMHFQQDSSTCEGDPPASHAARGTIPTRRPEPCTSIRLTVPRDSERDPSTDQPIAGYGTHPSHGSRVRSLHCGCSSLSGGTVSRCHQKPRCLLLEKNTPCKTVRPCRAHPATFGTDRSSYARILRFAFLVEA